jgi:hypothetical protein
MVPESVLEEGRLLFAGFAASIAELTQLAAMRPRDLVVVDDVQPPVSSNESLNHLMNQLHIGATQRSTHLL